MSIRIHKSREIGYDEHGQSVLTEESHVKILSSFKRGALRMLKGSPLSVFICIALHEADDEPGASLSTIHEETGYDRKTVIYALRFLEDQSHRFIEQCGQEADGTNRYRPAAYAWFGNDRSNKRSSIPQVADTGSASPIRQDTEPEQASSIRREQPKDKTSPVLRTASGKIPPLARRKFPPRTVVVEVTSPSYKEDEKLTTTESRTRVRKILADAGFYGKPLEDLSGKIPEDLARRWARWISWAEEYARDTYHSPAGMAAYHLLDNSEAEPLDEVPEGYGVTFGRNAPAVPREAPGPNDSVESRPDQGNMEQFVDTAIAEIASVRDQIPGMTSASETWHATLGELELQMTKATFDTWVRPTFPIGFDEGGAMVIGVHSTYAKEWLENRLQATVQRTVTGIVGHAVGVHYLVADRNRVRNQ